MSTARVNVVPVCSPNSNGVWITLFLGKPLHELPWLKAETILLGSVPPGFMIVDVRP